jgi:hypothetical protein
MSQPRDCDRRGHRRGRRHGRGGADALRRTRRRGRKCASATARDARCARTSPGQSGTTSSRCHRRRCCSSPPAQSGRPAAATAQRDSRGDFPAPALSGSGEWRSPSGHVTLWPFSPSVFCRAPSLASRAGFIMRAARVGEQGRRSCCQWPIATGHTARIGPVWPRSGASAQRARQPPATSTSR